MRGELSPPRPTPSSPVGGEMVLSRVPNLAGTYSPGTPASTLLGNAKLGWLKALNICASKRNDSPSRNAKLPREVDVGVSKVRPAHRVAARVAELAVGWRIAAGACAGGGIDDRDKGLGIEPLPRAGNGHAGIGRFAVNRHAGNAARKLRPAGSERPRCRWRCRAGSGR